MATTATAPSITVIQAAYGAVQGARDVTGLVQDIVNSGNTNFTADNKTLGGDPSQGHDKHFAMSYRVGSSLYTYACEEDEKVSLRIKETPPGEFTVIGAVYGAINPNNPAAGSRDVTAIVQQLLDDGTREFEPSNELFGDPFEGPRKNFGMSYYQTSNPGKKKAIASDESQKVTVTP
jgi:hypothetical protein